MFQDDPLILQHKNVLLKDNFLPSNEVVKGSSFLIRSENECGLFFEAGGRGSIYAKRFFLGGEGVNVVSSLVFRSGKGARFLGPR